MLGTSGAFLLIYDINYISISCPYPIRMMVRPKACILYPYDIKLL
jgi:hypothetical protein